MDGNFMELNRISRIPLYYQLAETLREQIASGELKPGEQIPTERSVNKPVSAA
jgi:DNA-binding GntR family transcriptional regulator